MLPSVEILLLARYLGILVLFPRPWTAPDNCRTFPKYYLNFNSYFYLAEVPYRTFPRQRFHTNGTMETLPLKGSILKLYPCKVPYRNSTTERFHMRAERAPPRYAPDSVAGGLQFIFGAAAATTRLLTLPPSLLLQLRTFLSTSSQTLSSQ